MGLFSRIFTNRSAVNSAINTSFLQTYSGGSAGWGLDRFNSIIEAHSSPEEIVEEFELDQPGCGYSSLDGYESCWTQAYEEEYELAEIMSDILAEEEVFEDPEDLIDWEVVEEKAFAYAVELVEAWLDGSEWCPQTIMDWAYYEVSDHNW